MMDHNDDGMAEEVAQGASPRQPHLATLTASAAFQRSSGGLLKPFEGLSGDFIQFRSPGRAIKTSLSHFPALGALWRVHGRKRIAGTDPGSTGLEIALEMGAKHDLASPHLQRLVRAGLVRAQAAYRGNQTVASLYYPTDEGVMLYAAAQTFGLDTSIQIGKTSTRWNQRSLGEPGTIFTHARIIGQQELGIPA